MVRFTFARASLMAIAAAGFVAVAATGPAWAQARTTPDATDCAAMPAGAKHFECMQQLDRQEQQGSSLFSHNFDIRVVPPDQRGIGMEGAGGGTQSPVVPNNGARAPLGDDSGGNIGTLHW
ncbi:MAG TPA: hypothetical protein VHE77_02600 [Dongiaceae bacterium]|jgi:hypothetical protein|nr:hypothetical protein [Dongiaceae bacterium]